MIEKNTEKIYDIILSIFIGIILALMIDKLFQKPRTVTIYKNTPPPMSSINDNSVSNSD